MGQRLAYADLKLQNEMKINAGTDREEHSEKDNAA